MHVGNDLQWASYTSNSIHTTDQPHVCWTLPQRDRNGDDEDRAAEDTCRADACNSTPDDEGGRVGGDTADEGADFEDE